MAWVAFADPCSRCICPWVNIQCSLSWHIGIRDPLDHTSSAWLYTSEKSLTWRFDMRRLGAAIVGIALSAHMLAADRVMASGSSTAQKQRVIDSLSTRRFDWTVSPPLVRPVQRPGDLTYSIKDPTIVRYNGRWHLFCTIRGRERSHQIEYLCFDDWKNVNTAKRYVLELSDTYFCAPQVFYFTPEQRWYLIYQVIDK